ncbi:hypothetical protein MHYP_G00171620 [Metynnis hypsauchen]
MFSRLYKLSIQPHNQGTLAVILTVCECVASMTVKSDLLSVFRTSGSAFWFQLWRSVEKRSRTLVPLLFSCSSVRALSGPPASHRPSGDADVGMSSAHLIKCVMCVKSPPFSSARLGHHSSLQPLSFVSHNDI